jgi:hypothetical protein
VLTIVSKMKEDLIIFDRVRYSLPERKLFSQVSFFQLIKGELYKKCFMGSNAIDWVLKNSSNEIYIEKRVDNREEAKAFLQILLEANLIHHVTYATYFIDGPNLYKFADDDRYRILNLNQDYYLYSIERISSSAPDQNVSSFEHSDLLAMHSDANSSQQQALSVEQQ